jgi:hypothetical protein
MGNGGWGYRGTYMINRTKLTISNVIEIRNPTKTNAIPVAPPLKRRDISPKMHRRIVLPATQREYPLIRSCERDVLSALCCCCCCC